MKRSIHTIKSIHVLAMALVAMCLVAPPAYAQSNNNPGDALVSSIEITQFFFILGIALGAGAGGMAVTTSSATAGTSQRVARSKKREPLTKRVTALDMYVQHNQDPCRQDFVLGAGECVRDMASILAIPKDEYSAFGRHVRKHRKRLIELMAQPADQRKWATYGLLTAHLSKSER